MAPRVSGPSSLKSSSSGYILLASAFTQPRVTYLFRKFNIVEEFSLVIAIDRKLDVTHVFLEVELVNGLIACKSCEQGLRAGSAQRCLPSRKRVLSAILIDLVCDCLLLLLIVVSCPVEGLQYPSRYFQMLACGVGQQVVVAEGEGASKSLPSKRLFATRALRIASKGLGLGYVVLSRETRNLIERSRSRCRRKRQW